MALLALAEKPATAPLPETLSLLRTRAVAAPDQLALRHKRRGRWWGWRWLDVAEEVDRLSLLLADHGFGRGSRLALSGPFEPTLLLLALAAATAGGESFTVARQADEGELERILAERRPTHAFVQGRDAVAHWLEAARRADAELWLLSEQAGRQQESGRVRIAVIEELERVSANAGRGRRPAVPVRLRPPGGTLWVEEGTEWQGGLEVVLEQWLTGGSLLAFPESPLSASRDRREVEPERLVLSSLRLAALSREIAGRLSAPGTWRRRASDWALAPGALRGFVRGRIRRLLGLRRLREIAAVPAQGALEPLPDIFRALGTRPLVVRATARREG